MKKVIAVILTFCTFALMLALPTFADSVLKPGSKYPTVYIPGRNEDSLVNDVSSASPQNIRTDIDIDAAEFAKTLGPEIVSGLSTGQWDGYSSKLLDLVTPMFSDVALGKDGLPADNSGVIFDVSNVQKLVQTDYTYRLDTYKMVYDYRLSPYDNADILNTYIENIKRATGAQKVNLLGRCEGANIVLAYLEKYGTPEEINHILFAWPAVYGLSGITGFFTGNISLDMDALETSLASGNNADSLATACVQVLNLTNSLDSGADLFNEIYAEIKTELMPDLILNTFGNMPSFWSMVAPEKYEQAKTFVFEGKYEEYAGLIEKIDYYYEHAGNCVAQILKSYTDAGVKFSCIAKYGYPASSLVTDDRNRQSDGMATVTAASLGATAADFGNKLSNDYRNSRTALGLDNYISPDGIIDASTCLYPDSTWFVKNIAHSKMPAALENFCSLLLGSDNQPTVNQTERYPGFLLYDERNGALVPMTQQNDIDKSDTEALQDGTEGFFAKIAAFFKALFAKIKSFFIGTKL